MNYEEAKNIPGMIEPVERKMLFNQAKEILLDDTDCVVEFGSFFGRSTNCIAQGLLVNPKYTPKCSLYTYDSFECDVDGWFAPHVFAYAIDANVSHFIDVKNEKVNFEKVFTHYLRSYISSNLVKSIKSELHDCQAPNSNIALMHVDSPKYYEEFKIILYRFFPKTKIGTIVVFQDFFYHWSGSLILIIAILVKKGFIAIKESAASSLVGKILIVPSRSDILELDLVMQNHDVCPEYFDFIIEECSKIEIDRKEQFLPRLSLAKMQWFYSNEKYNDARKTMEDYLKEGNTFTRQVIDDFLEIFKNGFSIRRLFEKDHEKKK